MFTEGKGMGEWGKENGEWGKGGGEKGKDQTHTQSLFMGKIKLIK